MNGNAIFQVVKKYSIDTIVLFAVANPAEASLLAKPRDYITNAYLMPRLDYVMFYCVHRHTSVYLTRQLL